MGLSDDGALQRRLEREAWQRQDAVRKQAEFDRQNRERLRQEREAFNRSMQQRNDAMRAQARADEERLRRQNVERWNSIPAKPFERFVDLKPAPGAERLSGWGQRGGGVAGAYSEAVEPRPAKPKKPWFPGIDRKFDEFLGPPKRAVRIMGLFALMGLLIGLGYAGAAHESELGFGVLGALLGFMFLHVMKFALKVVLLLLMLGVVVGIFYALAHLGK